MSWGYSYDMSLLKEIRPSNLKLAGNRTPKRKHTISYKTVKTSGPEEQARAYPFTFLRQDGNGSPWEKHMSLNPRSLFLSFILRTLELGWGNVTWG
jgi:hypothetical protein